MGCECPKCIYKIRKLPHQLDLQKVIELVNTKYKHLNLEIVDDKYIDRNTRMKVRCKVCDNISYKTYNCIVTCTECWTCFYIKIANTLKIPTNEVKEIVKNYGYEMLDSEYKIYLQQYKLNVLIVILYHIDHYVILK